MGILTGFMFRSLPRTVPDSNFSLNVIQVMVVECWNKEVSTVIDSWLYTMYVYLCIIVVCIIPHEDCCESVVCWIQVISVI